MIDSAKICYNLVFVTNNKRTKSMATKVNYNEFSIHKLVGLFDNAERQRTKLQADIKRLWAKIDEVDKRKVLIANAMAIKIKEPSDRLKEAIMEVEDMKKNPNTYKGYSSAEEVIEACLND